MQKWVKARAKFSFHPGNLSQHQTLVLTDGTYGNKTPQLYTTTYRKDICPKQRSQCLMKRDFFFFFSNLSLSLCWNCILLPCTQINFKAVSMVPWLNSLGLSFFKKKVDHLRRHHFQSFSHGTG